MHIHILGICGTFMGSLAVLAKQLGHRVSGSDANVYPPMSTQLQDQGIDLAEGFRPEHLEPRPDLVIIGNALSRGNSAVEFILNHGLPYMSGPQWLAQFVLQDKWVLGVAGTHGKTTTSAMLTWILEYAGLKPGYLIGGVTNNLPESASVGDSSFFVVEADEYDSAFFDKRSKFIHYVPRTLILNNLEFDHADIFDNLEAIEKQFHHLIRTVPSNGLIISPHRDSAIEAVVGMGCWTPRQQLGIDVSDAVSKKFATNDGIFWNASLINAQGSEFELIKRSQGETDDAINRAAIEWDFTGQHNIKNALAAVAAAHHVGVDLETAVAGLNLFKGVKRRMELIAIVGGISIYDDFAHHPTAIESTLNGMAAELKSKTDSRRLIAVIEPRSATMKLGVHQESLSLATQEADMVLWYEGEGCKIDFQLLLAESKVPTYVFGSVYEILDYLEENCLGGDHIIIMSNGGFEGIHDKLVKKLRLASSTSN